MRRRNGERAGRGAGTHEGHVVWAADYGYADRDPRLWRRGERLFGGAIVN